MRKGLRSSDLFAPKTSLWGRQAVLFSGRSAKVREGVEAVEVPGATAVIYGDRGVGKTSYAWQLFEILNGNEGVRKLYPELDEPEGEFVCFWIECEQRYRNVPGLLLALLRPTHGKKGITLRDCFPKIFDAQTSDRIERAYTFNIGVASAKISIDPGSRSKDEMAGLLKQILMEGAGDPYELFGEFLNRAKEREPEKDFIIFVDEFDRLPDRSGMGDFVKHCGEARLVLVGVAGSVGELVVEHPSADRKLIGSKIEVPPLEDDEVEQIFRKAERHVAAAGYYEPVVFNNEFTQKAVSAAGGYPSIAQFLGFEAVRVSRALTRARERKVEIGLGEYSRATERIFSVDELREGIGRSRKRAAILDALAEFPAGWLKMSTLRNALIGGDVDGFNRNLNILETAGVVHLERTKGRVKFATPALRLMVRLAREAGVLYPKR
jgi:Cdc6-like AAA superfamily ATPase